MRNQRKKNKIGLNSFNMSNATKTFKKLLEKNKKEDKSKKKNNIYHNKIDAFFNSLNSVFFKEEIRESDFDYIFREIKKQIKINQHMVDLYGVNAQNKVVPQIRDPVKFDKKLLFNPLKYDKYNEPKQTRYSSFNYKNDKKINLPCILKKNITITNNSREKSEKNLLIKKLESNKNINKGIINFNKLTKIKNDNSYDKNKSNNSTTFNNERYRPIKSNNFFSKTNNNLLTLNNNSINNNSTFTLENKSNNSFDRSEYLLTLDNLKAQIRHNQRRQRIYFNSNDYGCELFKSKYNYITQKYFN